MKLLDLFCGSGGAAKGYHLAGFDKIIGVDHKAIDNYPYEFIEYDALDYLWEEDLRSFDLIHASPPCQAYSWATNDKASHERLIPSLRKILLEKCCYYVIENVPNSDVIASVILEGSMFGLPIKRRRLFETNWDLHQPKFIRGKKAFVTVAGNNCTKTGGATLYNWQFAMQINWMNRQQLAQAIPPKYTKYIGEQFIFSHKNNLL